jgi:hypothetical protein
MSQDLAKKLQLKPGCRLAILNAPEGYLEALESTLPEGCKIVEPADAGAGEINCVQVFVQSMADVQTMAPVALKAVSYDGLLWMCYPKKSSGIKTDIHRDMGWDVLREAGYEGVRAISIDDVWSGLRFRPKERVGS